MCSVNRVSRANSGREGGLSIAVYLTLLAAKSNNSLGTHAGTGGPHEGIAIGGLRVYQAGGPPLDFEKTESTLLGLRGHVGETWRCREERLFETLRASHQFLDAWFL
jgi:hypothetical protein